MFHFSIVGVSLSSQLHRAAVSIHMSEKSPFHRLLRYGQTIGIVNREIPAGSWVLTPPQSTDQRRAYSVKLTGVEFGPIPSNAVWGIHVKFWIPANCPIFIPFK
jgi:hypothetical protein